MDRGAFVFMIYNAKLTDDEERGSTWSMWLLSLLVIRSSGWFAFMFPR